MTFIATSSSIIDPSFEDLGSTMLLPFSASAAVLAASDEDDDFVFDDDDGAKGHKLRKQSRNTHPVCFDDATS
jgi:hypothetical protein